MLFKPLAAIALLASIVVADGAAILQSLRTVDKDLGQLNSSVVAFDGNLLLTIPILAASTTLQNDLKAGTKTAQKSAVLNDTETFALIPFVNQLTADANITLTSLINKKPQFQSLLLTGIIKLILQDSQKYADQYSSAIISKVPAAYQDIAKSLVAPLDTGFNLVIAAYS